MQEEDLVWKAIPFILQIDRHPINNKNHITCDACSYFLVVIL